MAYDANTPLTSIPQGSAADWISALRASGVGEDEASAIAVRYVDDCDSARINWDIALGQACLETGWFTSDRWKNQQNPCGLGITSPDAEGIDYILPEIGIRAHVAHLCDYAYSSRGCPSCAYLFWFDPRHVHHFADDRVGALTRWATDPLYVSKVLATTNRVVFQSALPAPTPPPTPAPTPAPTPPPAGKVYPPETEPTSDPDIWLNVNFPGGKRVLGKQDKAVSQRWWPEGEAGADDWADRAQWLDTGDPIYNAFSRYSVHPAMAEALRRHRSFERIHPASNYQNTPAGEDAFRLANTDPTTAGRIVTLAYALTNARTVKDGLNALGLNGTAIADTYRCLRRRVSNLNELASC